MNKKGENEVNFVIITFLAIIVGLSLITVIYQNVGSTTNTATTVNQTVTLGAAGTNTTLNGKALVGSVIMTNASSGTTVSANGYSVTQNTLINGVLGQYLTNSNASWASRNVNLSYTYEPLGYESTSSGRSVIQLIAIFSGLAIAVIALVPTLRNKIMDMFG